MQQIHQSQPLPRQSKKKAKELAAHILALQVSHDAAVEDEWCVWILAGDLDITDTSKKGTQQCLQLHAELGQHKANVEKFAKAIARQTATLGSLDVDVAKKLKDLGKNIFYTHILNMCVLKTRIRECIRTRKMERKNLGGKY